MANPRAGCKLAAVPGFATLSSPLGELTFRPEREDDAEFRFALFRSSRQEEWEKVPLDPTLLGQIMRQQFNAQAASYRARCPHGDFDIIELAGEPIGRIVVDRPDGEIHLVDVAIVTEHRRHGLGDVLLRALMDEAAREGLPLRLEVAADNAPAIGLYRGLGFVETDRTPMYLRMEWTA